MCKRMGEVLNVRSGVRAVPRIWRRAVLCWEVLRSWILFRTSVWDLSGAFCSGILKGLI